MSIKSYLKHLFASFLFLFILFGGLFLFRDQIIDVFLNPHNYFNSELSIDDLRIELIFSILVAFIVLISYIFYLLLTFNSRSEIVVWNATKSLAFSKEEFKWIYENAPVPYMLLDKKANINEPNKSALRFFEARLEEIEGKNLFSFTAHQDDKQVEKLFSFFQSNLSFDRKEVEFVTKSGVVKTVLLSIFEMKNPTSLSNVGLAMLFDITEQKFLDKQKTEFVSLASHQLKAPLATTKWYTEMLTSGDIGEISEKQKEYINRLSLANEEMIELVDVLLNVSRVEMGTLMIDKKQTNVEELTESIFGEFSVEIERKNIHVEKKYDGNLQNIKSDPKLLRIVIQNLISNAVKYTPQNGTISVIFEQAFLKGGRIIVSDTGVGIPKNAQSKIFSKLFRADNVRKLENINGTGLGLYLVKSIMSTLGGSISFVSEENKGSVFTINL